MLAPTRRLKTSTRCGGRYCEALFRYCWWLTASAFFWTASAATYLILRREVDHAEFDLIDMPVVETKPSARIAKAIA